MSFRDSKKMIAFTIAIIFFVVLDRVLKRIVLDNFFSLPVKIIGDILKFSSSSNYNIAFSLPLGGWLINIIIIIIILLLMGYFMLLSYRREYAKAGWLIFIIFGALSNLIDRFKYGYVIDYLDLKYFTVFNLADTMIVSGVLGLILTNIINKKYARSF